MYKIGLGTDIHRLIASDNPIIIGGVAIDCGNMAVANSDGDALMHAITDAILGALAIGDIGEYFPNDSRSSEVFLQFACNKMQEMGYNIVNIDANVILEKPKLTEYKDAICKSLANIMSISCEQINIKAKTNEKMDAVGQGNAIETNAVVLLEK